MKKALAYAATAIILGLAIMMLPKTLEPQPTTGTPQEGDMTNKFLMPTSIEYGSKTTLHGLGSQPVNLFPSSLIVLSGFVAALSLYVILKKRTV